MNDHLLDEALAKRICDLTWNTFDKLSHKAKPNQNEWTVLASIVAEHLDPEVNLKNKNATNDSANRLQLICLASGTKLITGAITRQVPNLLLDCHAENLCRKLLKRWLLDRLLSPNHWNLAKLEHTRLHMFVSQLPCGSIRRYQGDVTIRHKPGRGERSHKAPCADKLLKWTLLGLQGKQLFPVLGQTLRLHSFVVGWCEPQTSDHSLTLLQQCFCLASQGDVNEPPVKRLRIQHDQTVDEGQFADLSGVAPKLAFVSSFRPEVLVKSDTKRPSNKSIVYYEQLNGKYQMYILVDGRAQGVTLKALSKAPALPFSPVSMRADLDKLCEKMFSNQQACGQRDKLLTSYEQTLQRLAKLDKRLACWQVKQQPNIDSA